MEHKDPRVQLEIKELWESKAQMETMEHKAHPERLEPRVNKEKKVHQEKMV